MRILAVDDEKISLEALVDAINEALPNEEIVSFRDAKEALEYVKDRGIYATQDHKLVLDLEILKEEYEVLKTVEDWTVDALHDTLMEYIANKEIKNGTGLWPVRTAVSGKQMTPGGAFEIMDILGKDESLRRIEIGIAKLEEAQNA